MGKFGLWGKCGRCKHCIGALYCWEKLFIFRKSALGKIKLKTKNLSRTYRTNMQYNFNQLIKHDILYLSRLKSKVSYMNNAA